MSSPVNVRRCENTASRSGVTDEANKDAGAGTGNLQNCISNLRLDSENVIYRGEGNKSLVVAIKSVSRTIHSYLFSSIAPY